MKDYFNKLFIFELANNHMGSLAHGLKIIRALRKVINGYDFNFAVKLQYRDLNTFIHPDYRGRSDIKYIKRFTETQLNHKELKALKDEISSLGFISVCTPFDEASVDLIEEHGFDIIKIGSCSFTDWPLLERVVGAKKPIIASTAGVSLKDLDRVVAFLDHRNKQFALMHCVSVYPTESSALQLNQVSLLKARYSGVAVGLSSHEEPDSYDSVKMAIAKGAVLFERHVGIKTKDLQLNNYTLPVNKIRRWLNAASEAYSIAGFQDARHAISEVEISTLRDLKRGAFAKCVIRKGQKVEHSELFFAIPSVPGQVQANDMSKYNEFTAKKDIRPNQPVMLSDLDLTNQRQYVEEILIQARNIVSESKIALPNRFDLELSHHIGIENFKECGAIIINCINREYCKKLIILFPGQRHPVHHHLKKEETFHVLHGDIVVGLESIENEYKKGDIIIIERGSSHGFKSKNGAVLEEISTTHYLDDSYYLEEKIMNNKHRKTEMTLWSDWFYRPLT